MNVLYNDVEVKGRMAQKQKNWRKKGRLSWRWWQKWCTLFLLPATFSLLPVFSSASLIGSPPLLSFELMCHFIPCAWFLFIFFSPLRPLLLCFRCRLWKATPVVSISFFFPSITVFPFSWLSTSFFFLPPSEIRCCHSPWPLFFFITLYFAQYFSKIWYTVTAVTHLNFMSLSAPPPPF